MCLFWSWYINRWIKPSGKQNKTKEHLQLFFFCLYSCPQIPPFLTERGHGCKPHLPPSSVTIFRWNPLVLGADISPSSRWSPGAGRLPAARGRLSAPWGDHGDVFWLHYPTAPTRTTTVWRSIRIALSERASDFLSRMSPWYADVLASWCWECGFIDMKPLLAVGGPLGPMGGYRAFY